MTSNKLSPKINIDNCISVEDIINKTYNEFKTKIMDKSIRPNLFNKLVFIKFDHWIDYKAEMYWHLVSLHEKETFNIFPCGNNISENICSKNCIYKTKQVVLKNEQVRDICIYRAVRINWINDIIELANGEDCSVKKWIKDDKLYLRFRHEEVDYVVIFEVKKNKYQLISAFPVFYINKKDVFDKDYKEYNKKSKNQ